MSRWSNTKLTTLSQCGEKYRRKYEDRDLRSPSPRMLRGSAVASVVAEIHKAQLKAKERTPPRTAQDLSYLLASSVPPADAVGQMAEDAFNRRVDREGVSYDPEDDVSDSARVDAITKAREAAIDGAAYYGTVVAPTINPLHVERTIVVKPQDSDLEISGILDIVAQGGQGLAPSARVIRDTKFTEKSPNSDAAHASQQLTMYAMLDAADTGALPDALVLDHVVRTPARHDLRYVPQYTTREVDDLRALVSRINVAVHAVEQGVFMPANPDSWWCSRTWCEYFVDCPYVSARRRAGE